MIPPINTAVLIRASLLGVLGATFIADQGVAQQVYNGYTMVETATQPQQHLIFGIASQKICEVKTFLFAAVYVLAAIAFVIFAVRALFTKFEMKHFIPIIGAIFIVASADLFIAWMSPSAWYCPTTMSAFSNG